MNELCSIIFTFSRIINTINTTIIIGLITLLSICLLGNLHLCLRLVVTLGSVRGKKLILPLKIKWLVLGICLLYDTFVIVLLFAPLLRCFFVKPVFSIYFRKLLVTTLSIEMTKEYTDTLFSFQKFFISWAKFSHFVIFSAFVLESLRVKGRYVRLTTLPPSCADWLEILEASTSRSAKGLSRLAQGSLPILSARMFQASVL